jgi:hypothetical protein
MLSTHSPKMVVGVHNPTIANSRLWISVDLYPTHMQPMVLEYAHQHGYPIYYTWSIWVMNSGFSNIDQYSPIIIQIFWTFYAFLCYLTT